MSGESDVDISSVLEKTRAAIAKDNDTPTRGDEALVKSIQEDTASKFIILNAEDAMETQAATS